MAEPNDPWPNPNEAPPALTPVVRTIHAYPQVSYHQAPTPRPPSWWTPARVAIACIAGAAFIGGAFLYSATRPPAKGTYTDEDRCIDHGRRYYRDVEMWPKLDSGRDAETVVRERCARSTQAFPD